jgi:hypothetical protein
MLSKNKILTLLASISIFLTFYACQKSFQLMSPESTSGVYNTNVAKTYYESIISSEESLLAMPYDQLKKNANLRRFARIGKMESLLDWENAQSFYQDKTNYTIVQVENISNHQANPNFESNRSLLFIQKDGDKMEMNIIEVYKKNDNLNEVDLSSGIKTFAENKIFNENKIIVGLNASILFYDQYYYNKSSFTVTNGIWEQASIIIENTSKRISSNSLSNKTVLGNNVSNTNNLSLSTTSPMSGCVNCTEYFTVGIWYDKRTGKVVESEILDKWDECKEPDYPANGNAPGTSNLPKLPPSDKIAIKNKVLHPCISSVLDNITDQINSFVQLALGNDNINMIYEISDQVPMADPNDSGVASPPYLDSVGNSVYPISLNKDSLSTSSKEYITLVILHEALHGVLGQKGIYFSNKNHHFIMATYSYHNILSETLKKIHGLSDDEANALAWGGLTNTVAFGELPIWYQQKINDTVSRYKYGSSGTKCK